MANDCQSDVESLLPPQIHSVATGQLLFTAIFDSVPTAVATDPAECHLFVGSDKGLIARLNLFELVRVD